MAVQWRTETLLVEVVADETDRTAEDEQAVQRADLDVLIGFLGSKCARITQEINEANGDASVNVENELKTNHMHKSALRFNCASKNETVSTHRILLRSGHLFDCKSVV